MCKQELDDCQDLEVREAVLRELLSHWENRNSRLAGLLLGELADTQVRRGRQSEAIRFCQEVVGRQGDNALGLAALRAEIWARSAESNAKQEITARLETLVRQSEYPRLAARARASLAIRQIESGDVEAGVKGLDEIVLSEPTEWLDLEALRRVVGVYRAHAERARPQVMEQLARRYSDLYREIVSQDDPTVLVRRTRIGGGSWHGFEVVSPFRLREEVARIWRDVEKLRACDQCYGVGTAEHRQARRNALDAGRNAQPVDLLTSPCSDLAVVCYDDILHRITGKQALDSLAAKFESLREKAPSPRERLRARLFPAKARAWVFDFTGAVALYGQILEDDGADDLARRLAKRDLLHICAVGGFAVPDGITLGEMAPERDGTAVEDELNANDLIWLAVCRKDVAQVRRLSKQFREKHGYMSLEMLWAEGEPEGLTKVPPVTPQPAARDVLRELGESLETLVGSSDHEVQQGALERFRAAASTLPANAAGAVKQLLVARIVRHRGWDGELLRMLASNGPTRQLGPEWGAALRVASMQGDGRWGAWEAASQEAAIAQERGRLAEAFLTLQGFVNRHFPEPEAVDLGEASDLYFRARYEMASIRRRFEPARESLTAQEKELLEVWPERGDPDRLARRLARIEWAALRDEVAWRVANGHERTRPWEALRLYEELARRRGDGEVLSRRIVACRLRELAREANARISLLVGNGRALEANDEKELRTLTEHLTQAFVNYTTCPEVLALVEPLLWAYAIEGLVDESALIVRSLLAQFPAEKQTWRALAGYVELALPALAASLEHGSVSVEVVLAHLGEIALAVEARGEAGAASQSHLRALLDLLEKRVEARGSETDRLEGLSQLVEAARTSGDERRAINLCERMAERAKSFRDADAFVRWSLAAADGPRLIAPTEQYLYLYRRVVQSCPNHPRTPDVLMQVIAEYEGMGDYASAAVECERFVRLYPRHEQAEHYQYHIADCYYKGGMHDLCAVAIEKALLARGSKQADLLLLAGLNRAAQKQEAEAIATWQDLDRRFPESPANARGLFLQGYTHLTRQEYAEAKVALDKLVKAFPNSSYTKRAKDLSGKIERVLNASSAAADSPGGSDAPR